LPCRRAAGVARGKVRRPRRVKASCSPARPRIHPACTPLRLLPARARARQPPLSRPGSGRPSNFCCPDNRFGALWCASAAREHVPSAHWSPAHPNVLCARSSCEYTDGQGGGQRPKAAERCAERCADARRWRHAGDARRAVGGAAKPGVHGVPPR
jgi:hypothetical protein